ncbi:hypothetical protein EV379_2806 [Microterricola gilva]|uniref:Uncharacterized protein n=1 Tax=Microterricola gilva TaxID=393267 RepID=A0A4Q8AQX7_9MICO|nr:hypothetical protein [Microterricola gilva]RZU66449.1 hypothetical protein EV379_2806 [Microterricola gilva]
MWAGVRGPESSPAVVSVVRALTEVIARRTSITEFARCQGIDDAEAGRLEAAIVNAVMVRRMTGIDGIRTVRVPTPGLDVFVCHALDEIAGATAVSLHITVTNELPVPLIGVSLACSALGNSAMSALELDGAPEAVPAVTGQLGPGESIEYRARYTATAGDFLDDAVLIASFVAQAVSASGERAMGQGDAWIALDDYAGALARA